MYIRVRTWDYCVQIAEAKIEYISQTAKNGEYHEDEFKYCALIKEIEEQRELVFAWSIPSDPAKPVDTRMRIGKI